MNFRLSYYNAFKLLNQAYAGLWPVCTWFFEIAFVYNVIVYVCVCAHVRTYVSAPKAMVSLNYNFISPHMDTHGNFVS